MKCTRVDCKHNYQWPITSADGVCFPCRWPQHWDERSEAYYQKELDKRKVSAKSSDATVRAAI